MTHHGVVDQDLDTAAGMPRGIRGGPHLRLDTERRAHDLGGADRVERIGIPTSVVVGRGLANGVVEVKDRATGQAREVPVAEAADAVASLVAG